MDKIRIKGNANLKGNIDVPGSKNASLPILVSSLLSKNNLTLMNVPNLADIETMIKLLESFGVKTNNNGKKIILNARNIENKTAEYDLVRKMRASILVLGPLLSRFKEAKISLPGGCAIGTRPIDIHLSALSKLGVNFEIENGFVKGYVRKKLCGSIINLPFPSVGATENILMASCLAEGTTIINNPAKEPEIIDLANALNVMGAKIFSAGSDTITIHGVKHLGEAEYNIMFDRIVAGTFILAAVMTNNEFIINKIDPSSLSSLIETLNTMNAKLKINQDSIKVLRSNKIIGTNVETAPYPGFPTDLQAQIMSLMSIADGPSTIIEKIFENRFMHVAELNRLGADIKIQKDKAFINGNRKFKGAQVMASDLRASVSLILAGLCAEGDTVVNRVYHLDRGYEKIEETLGKCGPIMIREK